MHKEEYMHKLYVKDKKSNWNTYSLPVHYITSMYVCVYVRPTETAGKKNNFSKNNNIIFQQNSNFHEIKT